MHQDQAFGQYKTDSTAVDNLSGSEGGANSSAAAYKRRMLSNPPIKMTNQNVMHH